VTKPTASVTAILESNIALSLESWLTVGARTPSPNSSGPACPTICRSAARAPHERSADVTPMSLRRLRPLQRLVGQRFHSALASRSGNHASRRRDGTTSVRDAAARAIRLTAPFTTTARPLSPFPSVKTLSNPIRTSQPTSVHELASGFNLLLFRCQEIRPRRLPNALPFSGEGRR